MTGLTCLKELILIKSKGHADVLFAVIITSVFEVNFRFKPKTYDDCHDSLQKAMSVNDVAIVFVKGNDYRIHCWYMSIDKFINIMENSDSKEKSGTFQNYNFF